MTGPAPSIGGMARNMIGGLGGLMGRGRGIQPATTNTALPAELRANYPPIRQQPAAKDQLDDQRVELVHRRFRAQDPAYLAYARTVEMHIRMLSGRQWDTWSDLHGRFVDLRQFMSAEEKRWRMQPVMDYLGYWFLLTLAKATENEPILSFQPSTADRVDAMLAEVMEPVWKTMGEQMNMSASYLRMAAWQLAAGEGYFVTRVDFERGEPRQLIGPAQLTLERPGLDPITRMAAAVPFDEFGKPQAQLVPDPDNPNDPDAYGYDVLGEPWQELEGSPKVDVVCPLQVRAQWGQHIPWEDKKWVILESFLQPGQVWEQYGILCRSDHYAGVDQNGGAYLERMLFGAGYFGAVTADPISTTGAVTRAETEEGFVRVLTMWEKPIPGMTDDVEGGPGGRLLVVAPGSKEVLWDSARPFKTECAGPIRRVPFFDIPGRPHGTTLLERMVPIQKRLNRVEAHIAQHTNLCTNPILLVHEAAGIDTDSFVSRPGLIIEHGYNGPGRAAEFISPPPLSADVWKHKQDLVQQLFVVGSMTGNQSEAPTGNASGNLVQELRVNADRPLTPLTRNLTIGVAGVAEDLVAVLPTIWDRDKVISYAGEDSAVRTVTVLPKMFEGRVHVKPSIESASADSKDSRRARVIQLFQMGAFGNPQDPQQATQARAMLLSLLQFPEMTRATRPGGVDRIMAEHNLRRLTQGDPAAQIPVLEVYDLAIHLGVLEGYMKAPEYLEQPPETQSQMVLYRHVLQAAAQAQAINQTQLQVPVAQAKAEAAGRVQATALANTPHPPVPPGAHPAAPGGAPAGAPPSAPPSRAA